MMPRVLFTGGGTAGHVTPNIALLEAAIGKNWDVAYVGSTAGIEREMIGVLGIPYYAVASGKLRRYFSWQNFIDPFFILWGMLQSLVLCLRLRPDVVFSKGGFVAVPLVVAAWLLRVPVISHESDVTPGLANRLTYPFCRKICVTFEATKRYLPGGKVNVTGTPVRQSLVAGDAAAGLKFLGFSGEKPVLLVFGGSLGAAAINSQTRRALPGLLQAFDVVHVVGNGNLEASIEQSGSVKHYVQKEFIGEQFGHVLAAAAVVVSRAGANSLYELLMARKPHLLIPLGKAASRGDQLDNARVFADLGFSRVLYEEALTGDGKSEDVFVDTVRDVLAHSEEITARLQSFEIKDSVNLIIELIQESV
ncbi:MAG: undecaprenyldiphospho-muramoylpentapeptide beta-N-acetylglucosaminyltransferase [Gammaproteobacteria bacterium]|nr:undecaprenyldiphospho-muramoylpentapeptide beta-N-acetylglucosaminyltransferase [Gammaproteobacteria bacterium]MBT5684942.1 undecaprenyldiphospho-muramoylpentapeptide beta-N-acetylglucosaminyltransferase [Gammaproteobacteria bacterium]MBT5723627.1 undecaprenyldiphospho-muramoylpentapeptide beta-N-acetylglucosaminyltransferase [Gammaproteobacteria bacterium]MBT6585034.1 undecaprenyldiphospho-muramoylpentapeptide beta-N-acetylglucosaminyltransferase [Gammaproteobacteria bacterium]